MAKSTLGVLAGILLLGGLAVIGRAQTSDATAAVPAAVLTDTPTASSTATPTATPTETPAPPPPFPCFYGGTENALVRVNEGGVLAWSTPVAGGVYSVETASDGSLLVAGGEGGVFLLARKNGDLKVLWDWKSLGFQAGDISSAASADKDPNGRVSLVVAAEPAKKRIFLAEAGSRQFKVRWEYATLLPPRQVGLCPDLKHFWVLCSEGPADGAWSLEEIDYKAGKADWSMETYLSGLSPAAFARNTLGWNLLSVPSASSVAAFLKSDNSRIWQSPPLGTAAARYLPVAWKTEKVDNGLFVSYSPENPEGATRVTYLSGTDGEEVAHLDFWTDQGTPVPLPAFRCIAPGPDSKKKAASTAPKKPLTPRRAPK